MVAAALAPILFLDTALRNGWGREFFTVEPPYVPGSGVAGEVVAVGDGVDDGWQGRTVVGHTGQTGGYAERAVVATEALVAVPDGVDLRAAAALMHDGRTALGLADRVPLDPQQRVLVMGAGGGLGLLLVQLAHAAGAQVLGAARGERKLALARESGADVTVDYSAPDWVDQVREATGGAGVSVVFDGVGGGLGRAAFELTARGGRVSTHGAPSGAFAAIDSEEAARREVTVTGIDRAQFTPEVSRQLVERALDGALAGRLRPVVGQTFPLAEAAAAHTRIEAREAVGKTLLVV